jgi:hypothetical protein
MIFRLLDLPTEVVISITQHCDNRLFKQQDVDTFPSNVGFEVLQLRLTNYQFYKLLNKLTWESRFFHYNPDYQQQDDDDQQDKKTRYKKSLSKLLKIINSNQRLINKPNSRLLPIIINKIYFFRIAQSGFKGEDSNELSAAIKLIDLFSPTLTLAFFTELSLAKSVGDELISLLSTAPNLKTLRLNQCDIGSLRSIDKLLLDHHPFPALRSLHVSFSSSHYDVRTSLLTTTYIIRLCMEGNETFNYFDSLHNLKR